MASPQDFFSNIKFQPKKAETISVEEVLEPEIIYPAHHWPGFSPDAAALQFIQNFKKELNVFVSAFSHAGVGQASIKTTKSGQQAFVIALSRDLRNFFNYKASLIYKHKEKKRPDFYAEIVCKYSEGAGCLLYSAIASYLGFKTRFKPDYSLYADTDMGDVRIGKYTLDHKHRNDSYNDGCFLDADYMEKHSDKITDDTYFVHTTGLKKWEINDFKTIDKAYEVAICGFFDANMFMEKSSLKRNGERRVLDVQDMCDLEQLFTLVIKGLMEEEGYIK